MPRSYTALKIPKKTGPTRGTGLCTGKFTKASEKAGMLPAFLRLCQARSARQDR
ncbi:hypothetical protein B4099_0236 [Heyndrickxia coagulans]|uniref:Uncharacterized protein n=1 Tax=Heyndrickxia coagulans TaxID=1398 RepID=A0A150KEM0_HEYCO|nr:hypothetical protein B4099_0236 [Heyndrickxia coagulans]